MKTHSVNANIWHKLWLQSIQNHTRNCFQAFECNCLKWLCSLGGIWVDALFSDMSSIQICCFAKDLSRNMQICSFALFLLRNQWIICSIILWINQFWINQSFANHHCLPIIIAWETKTNTMMVMYFSTRISIAKMKNSWDCGQLFLSWP